MKKYKPCEGVNKSREMNSNCSCSYKQLDCDEMAFSKLVNAFNLVIYHGGCQDGLAAYTVVRKYYRESLGKEIEGYPCGYNDPPPDCTKKTVLIVDFSFKRPAMDKIKKECDGFFLLDHHSSAQKELSGYPGCVFDMQRSGAMLAWDFFFPGTTAPLLVQYIQDKDLWKWEMPQSREFTAGMETFPYNPASWDVILNDKEFISRTISSGVAVLEYKQQLVKKIAKGATSFIWHLFEKHESEGEEIHQPVNNIRVAVVNTLVFANEVGEYLYNSGNYDVALIWNYEFESESYRFSLRSKAIDTSLIAARFGGGGHPGASGFYWKEKLEDFIKYSKLDRVESS